MRFCETSLGSATLSLFHCCFVSNCAEKGPDLKTIIVFQTVFPIFFSYLGRCFCSELKFDQSGVLAGCFRGLPQGFHNKSAGFIRFHREGSGCQASTRPIPGLHLRSDQPQRSAAGKPFRPLTPHLWAVLFHSWSADGPISVSWGDKRGFCVGVRALCGVEGHACPPPYHAQHILCLLLLNVLCCACARPPR